MSYSNDYDTDYNPAMPIVEVVLENTIDGQRGDKLTAIVDSGADGCIFPQKYLDEVGSKPIRQTNMVGITGISQHVELHLLILHIGPITTYGIEVIADRHNREAIVGRNVLNHLIVTLNGLASVIEITD